MEARLQHQLIYIKPGNTSHRNSVSGQLFELSTLSSSPPPLTGPESVAVACDIIMTSLPMSKRIWWWSTCSLVSTKLKVTTQIYESTNTEVTDWGGCNIPNDPERSIYQSIHPPLCMCVCVLFSHLVCVVLSSGVLSSCTGFTHLLTV